MATFSAFWALFLQFIVHSSMDCSKRFRRQKPLLVGKHAVMCMQIALGEKTSVNKRCDLCKGKLAGVWGGGIAPPQKFFSILSLKMATFSAFWALAHVARGAMAHPWIRQCSCLIQKLEGPRNSVRRPHWNLYSAFIGEQQACACKWSWFMSYWLLYQYSRSSHRVRRDLVDAGNTVTTRPNRHHR